ncbi:MAG: hypothetical protein AAFP13_01715 [Pseudomonadota bacterium]
MRLTFAAALLATLATTATAQEATIVLPKGNFGNYNPTLSAKEAVLANWEMAASGILAGEVLGRQVVKAADDGASFKALSRQAAFAVDTMVTRYNAAAWLYHENPGVTPMDDATLQGLVTAAALDCDAEDCSAEAQTIRAAFAQASAELGAATEDARGEIVARQDRVDAVLLSEQLAMVADYLESAAWGSDLVLTEHGRDADVLADRIVGAVALWRNVEPYVGLTSPEVDDAINAASTNLLRTMRRGLQGVERIEPESALLADLTVAASNLAAEFRRASALFAS